ncbi:MAG: hypothetical protein M1826_001325 [Phylliscum demangeonii]|nr:MAG: hypothetical protein M1826_001325 [Phylliscum demangeonii]
MAPLGTASYQICQSPVPEDSLYDLFEVRVERNHRRPSTQLLVDHAVWLLLGPDFKAYGARAKVVHDLAEEIVAKDPGAAFGRCLELLFEHSAFTIRPRFRPGLLPMLMHVVDFRKTAAKNVIPLSALEIRQSSADYLTERTALVSYQGTLFIAKGVARINDIKALYKECRLLGIMSHPNIIKAPTHVVTGDGRPDLVLAVLLEYHPRGNLMAYAVQVLAQGRRRLHLLRRWAIQFAAALDHVHAVAAHKYENIKPENAVVDEQENLILIDFVEKEACSWYGTAPEVHKNDPKRRWIPSSFSPADREKAMVYSLGRALWMIWEGYERNFDYRYMYFTEETTDVPAGWKSFLRTFTALRPAERPSFKEIIAFFEHQSPTPATETGMGTGTGTGTGTTVDVEETAAAAALAAAASTAVDNRTTAAGPEQAP